MSQLDALQIAAALKARLVDFASDDHYVLDKGLSSMARRIWGGPPERGGLVSDLWIEGAFPSLQSTESIDSLITEGIFDPRLGEQLDQPHRVPRHRRLYTHQYEAIKAATETKVGPERPGIVVSSGTGSGKTESFLLPVLNDLFAHKRQRAGVRCLILYPMNALVNDQVDRLYGWLQGQSEVSIFQFTSETPENEKTADTLGVPRYDSCRLRTREEARKRVPDILITNYSMLEYMLVRPQDAVFFGPELRSVVLDEAHLYTGTLAAEITLLLRRLYVRCGVNADEVLGFATSATLGDDGEEGLSKFCSTLFSKQTSPVQVIKGQVTRARLGVPAPPESPPLPDEVAAVWDNESLMRINESGETELVRDEMRSVTLRNRLQVFVSTSVAGAEDKPGEVENRPAVLLYQVLRHAPLFQQLEALLWQRQRIPLRELTELLWGRKDEIAIKATVAVLQRAASARLRADAHPLVPHRIHLMVRGSEGLSVCLDPKCPVEEGDKLPPLGHVFSGAGDHCPVCGGAALALVRCDECGEWVLSGTRRQLRLYPDSRPSEETLYFRPAAASGRSSLAIDPRTGEHDFQGVALEDVRECPTCGSIAVFKPFVSGTALTLSITAETLLANLPEFPSDTRHWLPAHGRRLLAFSDSRQEAARLGPALNWQHEIQLGRAAIIDVLSNQGVTGDTATRSELLKYVDMKALPPELRVAFEGEQRLLEEEVRKVTRGLPINEWARRLAKHKTLEQILDKDSAGSHYAAKWSQGIWENNARRVRDKATQFLSFEFARLARGEVTAETLGLVEVTYPGIEDIVPAPALLGALPSKIVREQLQTVWPDLVAALLDTLRSDGAIRLDDDLETENYTFGRTLINRWCTETESWSSKLIRFVGSTPRQYRRRFVAAVLGQAGLAERGTREATILAEIFKQLLQMATPVGESVEGVRTLPWLERSLRQTQSGSPVDGIRLVFSHLGLRPMKEAYRCEKTGRVYPRSVLGCGPNAGSEGTLLKVSHDDLDKDPRLGRRRSEYKRAEVFRLALWSEEHSAQLSPKENRRLQDLFKAGIRNVLSSTTTLELGIDIGGINAVFMSNVPPGKTNYLQRSGRAGRRADGSSIVVTFARQRPYDREVFQRIGDYLGQSLRRPTVLLDRNRVVRRHFHSYFLGEFFRHVYPAGTRVGAMNAFGHMGDFCGVQLPPRWDRQDSAKPAFVSKDTSDVSEPDLPWWISSSEGLWAQYVHFLNWVLEAGEESYSRETTKLFRHTTMSEKTDHWASLIQSVSEDFSAVIHEWRREYHQLLQAWRQTTNKSQANAIRYQLRALHALTVIEALADRQHLPHYGFPIGLQKLRVIVPGQSERDSYREEDQYRLERASLLALREYVPGSQLLVGGKVVTSRGLQKHWTGADVDNYLGIRGQALECTNGHYYYWTVDQPITCPICGAEAGRSPEQLMFPKHGFTSAAWDPPVWGAQIERVGMAETATMSFTQRAISKGEHLLVPDFAGVKGLTALYREDGEILVYNRGDGKQGFAICTKCGYAESETEVGEGRIALPRSFETHSPIFNKDHWAKCWPTNEAPVLRNQVLAAREVTDVLLLGFPLIRATQSDEAIAYSVGHALKRAGARLLELDTRELGVMVAPHGALGENLGVVIYDSVPGGAGHVRELLTLDIEWLKAALDILFVTPVHHEHCETACLDCILTFEAQDAMSKNLLQRRSAFDFLDHLLGLQGIRR